MRLSHLLEKKELKSNYFRTELAFLNKGIAIKIHQETLF